MPNKIMEIFYSDRLSAVFTKASAEAYPVDLVDDVDAWHIAGYNTGSTGSDNFNNGFQLALKLEAAQRQYPFVVFCGVDETLEDPIAYYVMAETEDHACERMQNVIDRKMLDNSRFL